MLEFIFNTIALIGFLLLLAFAWLGFKFVLQAMSFAAEMALLDWKYNKAKNMANEELSAKAFSKIREHGKEENE